VRARRRASTPAPQRCRDAPGCAGQCRTGQGRTRQGRTGQGRTGQGRTGQGRAGQGSARRNQWNRHTARQRSLNQLSGQNLQMRPDVADSAAPTSPHPSWERLQPRALARVPPPRRKNLPIPVATQDERQPQPVGAAEAAKPSRKAGRSQRPPSHMPTPTCRSGFSRELLVRPRRHAQTLAAEAAPTTSGTPTPKQALQPPTVQSPHPYFPWSAP